MGNAISRHERSKVNGVDTGASYMNANNFLLYNIRSGVVNDKLVLFEKICYYRVIVIFWENISMYVRNFL